MKIILLSFFLMANIAEASLLSCVSQNKKYEVHMDIDLISKKIFHMLYLKRGKIIEEFSLLDVKSSKDIFRPHGKSYEVIFDRGLYYMELDLNADGTVSGSFLPVNSILAFEQPILCAFN